MKLTWLFVVLACLVLLNVLVTLLAVFLFVVRLASTGGTAATALVGSGRFGRILVVATELERLELELTITRIGRAGNARGIVLVVRESEMVRVFSGNGVLELGIDRSTASLWTTAAELWFTAALEHLLGDLVAGVLLI